MGQEQEANDLMKVRDDLTQERDKLLNDVTQLRRDLDEGSFKQTDLEREIQDLNDQITSLQEKINQSRNENMKEAKKRVGILLNNEYSLISSFLFSGTN